MINITHWHGKIAISEPNYHFLSVVGLKRGQGLARKRQNLSKNEDFLN